MFTISRNVLGKNLDFEVIYNSMIELLICPICLDIFTNPTMIKTCIHVFCSKCLEKHIEFKNHHSCPECRNLFHKTNLIHDFRTERCLSTLNVKCSEKECKKEINIDNIENHFLNDCEYYQHPCKFNCGSKFNKSNKIDHENNCMNNPVVKINCNACSEEIYAISKKEHDKKCPEKWLRCGFKCCKETFKRKDLENHNDLFIKRHLQYSMKNWHKELAEKEEIKNELSKIKKDIEELYVIRKRINYRQVHVGFGNYESFLDYYSTQELFGKIDNIKNFENDEFEIIGFNKGTGDEFGTIIWKCKTKNDKDFEVIGKPIGTTYVEQNVFLENLNTCIGKMLNVSYLKIDELGVPQFPVGKTIRDL